jgi:hypothetical protein
MSGGDTGLVGASGSNMFFGVPSSSLLDPEGLPARSAEILRAGGGISMGNMEEPQVSGTDSGCCGDNRYARAELCGIELLRRRAAADGRFGGEYSSITGKRVNVG